MCCLTGSYTPMKMADAGTTPARLPHIPAYKALLPEPLSKAPRPPPEMDAWRRVLMVSIGYNAAKALVLNKAHVICMPEAVSMCI